jgi:protein-S-isoprenylcysteine O-methyltransferase Ste14
MPDAPAIDRKAIWIHWGINLALGAVWGVFAWWTLAALLETQDWIKLFPLIRNSLLCFFFLSRRPASRVSRQTTEWAVAVLGTFIGFLYAGSETTDLPLPLNLVSIAIMTIAPAVSILAVASLGRSFGIVPADRGLKTEGLYRFVRHPIYGAYIVSDIGYLMTAFSWHNAIIFVGFVLASALRAMYEERLLAQDPAYQEYQRRVRYRFFPGVY